MPIPIFPFRRILVAFVVTLAGTGSLTAADYHIDPAGNDSNAGTSPATPWQSLGKVNGTVFQPGDKVLFKRGGTWVGTLSPQGSGNGTSQITLGAYGTGAKPLINGNGNWAVIALSSQSYWTIDGFEVTNPASNDSSRSGIRVDWSGSGTMRGINILNNDVHDVRGIKNVNDGGRNNGGIFFWINEPGKADGVLIQGNTVKTIYGQGIAFNAEAEYAGGGMNYANCSPNVIARGNTVISTSGDGILMLGTDNELVEHNEVGFVGQLSDSGNNIAAAWPTRHINGLWQYNHVHHTKWLNANDSTAFDNDGFVSGATVFQYNYTHDNEGGFLMEYTWGGDVAGAMTIARYNISWNENRILASNRNSARFYNNVFYNPGGTLDVNWTPNPSYILLSNNLFVAAGRSAEFSRQLFMNNSFSGGVTRPVTTDGNRTQDPLFVSPNTTGNLAGFILQTSSPARNSGTFIGGNGGKDFWSATLPTSAPHRGASQISAIVNYTATPTFAQVSGPYSAAIPYSGSSTVSFSGTVRDQNFRPISGAAVTWSVAPALAGFSIDSSGVLTLSAGAQPQRVAIVAQSGSATATFSFTALPAVPPAVGSSWINPAGGDWSVAGNWQGNAIANGTDQTATVALSTGVTINQGDASRRIGHLAFSNANHTLQGNPLTLDVTTGASSISVADGTTATLGLALVSSDGLQKSGAGTLALTAASSYAGGTTVNQGTLELRGASGGTGLINGAVTVNSGATLAFTNGDGTGFGWSNTISNLTVNGGSVNASGGAHLGFGSYVNVAMTGGSSISGSWQWNGDGLLGFSSSGDSSNSISGNLVLRADAGANHSFNIANGAAATDLQVNAVLSDQWPEVNWVPASALVKSGAGTMEINASNSYDGGTTVSGGTLIVGTGGTLGSGNLTVNTGATCDLRNTSGAVANGASVYLNGSGKLMLASGLTETVARLYLDNAALSPGTYTAASHPALIGGAGSLVVTVGAPAVPSGLAANAASASSIQLTWTDNANDETGYIVERSLNSGAGFSQVASLAAGTVSHTDLGLSTGTAYFYRVRAINAIGSSASSAEATATTTLGNSGIWTSATSGNWSVAGNWQNGTVANGTGKTATIAQANAVTVTLDGTKTIGGLNFANGNHTLDGTSTLFLDVSTGSPIIDVASGATATLGVPLVGTEGLSKSGSGNLVIPISPGYSGMTSVTGGRLTFSGSVGTPPPAIPAMTYSLAGGSENWPADKRAAIIAAMDAAVGFYNRYASMPKALTANYDANVGTAQAGYGGWIDFGGSIGTRVALHEMGHTMGVGTYGSWSANQSGGVWTGANGVAMIRQLDGPAASIGCDTAHFWPYGLNYDDESGAVQFMRHVKVVSAMRMDMGIVSASELHGYDGNFDIASGAELEFTGNSVQLNGVVSGGGHLLHSGSGTLVLAANNTHTGGTTVNGGKLVLFANSGTGCIRGALTVNSGATVEATGDGTGLGWLDQISSVTINGGTLTSSGINHIWNIPGGITMTGGTLQSNNGTSNPNGPQLEWNRSSVTTLASANTATIGGRIRIRGDAGYTAVSFNVADGAAATDLLLSAAITEASAGLGITKSGAGKMTLTGSNNQSGATTVNAGTLVAETTGTLGSGNLIVGTGATCEIRNTAGAIGDTASVFLTGTGKLALASGVVETVSRLSVNGVMQPAGTYTSASSFITGSGSLIVTDTPLVWTSLTNGNWSTAANWLNSTVADGADNTATFAQATGVTVTLDSNRSIGGLSFANSNYTITGNTLTLATTFGSSNLQVNGAGVTATIGSSIAGASTLTKTGSGTLKLTNINFHSGGTTVNEGTLELAGASGGNSLVSGNVTVNSGATLALTGGDGTGFGWNNPISSLTTNGGTVNASGTSHLGFGAYATVALNQGGTIAGNWQWNGDGLLGFTSSGDATNTINGLLSLRSDAGANHTFNVADGAASVDLQINANLIDQYPEVWWLAASNLIKTGAGNAVLAGSNSHDGVTDIVSGMLTAAHSSALGAGGWSGANMTWIRNGATLALQGGISLGEHLHLLGSGVGGQGALRSLSGNNALTLTYGGSGSGPGFCFDGNTTVGVDAGTLTVTGFYEDAGSFGLTKVGNGTLHINSTNAYTGPTTINAGTLSLGNGTSNTNLADSASVIVASGGTLHLNFSGTDTVNALSFDGIARPPGVYSAANSSFITGPGTLTVLTGPATDYAGWVAFHGLTGGQTGDDDHDGLTNLAEYAFGLDPKDGASIQPITSLPSRSTGRLTYTRRKAALTGLSFTVWTSTNLMSWIEDSGATQSPSAVPGTDHESVEVLLSPALLASDRLFVRVQAH
ncbi:MAG: autotransporter-associated beta strand repeat-containing protein [Verrucomicrobia bacterium]|nr:autotransporter-associated beta strand repeat-containing protein [Verrucomicrobiota bacterium]